MHELTHKDRGGLSRQQAAERLTDIAYALTVGGPLTLAGGDETVVPVADQVVLELEATYDDGEVEISVTLSWSTRKSPGIGDDSSRIHPRASAP